MKVLICRRLDLDRLPTAFEIHDLEGLLVLTGLRKRLFEPESDHVKTNWNSVVESYKDHHVGKLRYGPDRDWNVEAARDLLDRLRDPTNGVLPWLLAQP